MFGIWCADVRWFTVNNSIQIVMKICASSVRALRTNIRSNNPNKIRSLDFTQLTAVLKRKQIELPSLGTSNGRWHHCIGSKVNPNITELRSFDLIDRRFTAYYSPVSDIRRKNINVEILFPIADGSQWNERHFWLRSINVAFHLWSVWLNGFYVTLPLAYGLIDRTIISMVMKCILYFYTVWIVSVFCWTALI